MYQILTRIYLMLHIRMSVGQNSQMFNLHAMKDLQINTHIKKLILKWSLKVYVG